VNKAVKSLKTRRSVQQPDTLVAWEARSQRAFENGLIGNGAGASEVAESKAFFMEQSRQVVENTKERGAIETKQSQSRTLAGFNTQRLTRAAGQISGCGLPLDGRLKCASEQNRNVSENKRVKEM